MRMSRPHADSSFTKPALVEPIPINTTPTLDKQATERAVMFPRNLWELWILKNFWELLLHLGLACEDESTACRQQCKQHDTRRVLVRKFLGVASPKLSGATVAVDERATMPFMSLSLDKQATMRTKRCPSCSGTEISGAWWLHKIPELRLQRMSGQQSPS